MSFIAYFKDSQTNNIIEESLDDLRVETYKAVEMMQTVVAVYVSHEEFDWAHTVLGTNFGSHMPDKDKRWFVGDEAKTLFMNYIG